MINVKQLFKTEDIFQSVLAADALYVATQQGRSTDGSDNIIENFLMDYYSFTINEIMN